MDLDTENHSFESGYVHEGWISYKDGPKTPEEVLESFKKENELVWKK
jgi:predicted DNA-binding transcriptional regulator